ncbi:unnamed protein product [Camellia sinensis]
MYPGGGYTAEVTNLSPRATEKVVYEFFAYCGEVEHVEIIRSMWIKLKILLGLSNQILWYQYVSQIKRFWCDSYFLVRF